MGIHINGKPAGARFRMILGVPADVSSLRASELGLDVWRLESQRSPHVLTYANCSHALCKQ